MKYVIWLWRNSVGERFCMGARVLVGVLQVAVGLLVIWMSKIFIDETVRVGSDRDIALTVVFLALAVVVHVLLRQLNYYLSVKSNARGINCLRRRVFSKIFCRNLYGEETLHSGDVASRVMKDVETVCDVNFVKLPQIAVTTVQLAGAFLLMRWFDPRLAWALLLLTPIALVLGKLISRSLRKMTAEIRENESRIQMHVQECAENDAMIRSMGSENFVGGLLDGMQKNLLNRLLVRGKFTVAIRILIGLSFGLGYMLAFVWGGIGLRNGTITFGVMTTFLQLVGQIQQPIFNLLNAAPQLIHCTASIDRIDKILIADNKLNFIQNVTGPSVGNNRESLVGIRFENVSFSYANGKNKILDNINLDFKPGHKVAVMGKTGAGKTTIFRLMLGLVKPQLGSVVIYGSERKSEIFAFVPQGNSLISGSLRLNLQMAKPNATEKEMLSALHTACADFVNELPSGLDTELGERGYGLSEGQAERIAVARGLLQNCPVMLLDEISASLDAKTEKEMLRRIFAANPFKTMIFITHREAVCELCDDIVRI